MKTLLLLSFMFFASVQSTNEAQVYICTGPQSACYHCEKDCRGLKRCSGEIKQISLAKAKEMGRRPCGFCYR